jgi:hypothetical protein
VAVRVVVDAVVVVLLRSKSTDILGLRISTIPKPYITPEQYLEIERAAEYKSEYFNGEMFAMSGESLNHSRIFHAVSRSLHNPAARSFLRNRRQRPSPASRTQRPLHLSGHRGVLHRELRSRIQVRTYRRLTSLKEYLVIAQNRVHLEHNTRQPDGSWNLREFESEEF